MADSAHRLAVNQAVEAAQAREQARQDAHSPLGGQGTSAGVTLSEAGPGDLAALGMPPGAEIQEHGELQQEYGSKP